MQPNTPLEWRTLAFLPVPPAPAPNGGAIKIQIAPQASPGGAQRQATRWAHRKHSCNAKRARLVIAVHRTENSPRQNGSATYNPHP